MHSVIITQPIFSYYNFTVYIYEWLIHITYLPEIVSTSDLKGQCHQEYVPDRCTGTQIWSKLEDSKWFHSFLFPDYSSMLFSSLFTTSKSKAEIEVLQGTRRCALNSRSAAYTCNAPLGHKMRTRCALLVYYCSATWKDGQFTYISGTPRGSLNGRGWIARSLFSGWLVQF